VSATTCMPCSFGLLPHPRSGMCAQPTGLLELTVTDRYIPLVTAACGTRVARPARTTTLSPDGDGSQLGRRVRPICGNRLASLASREAARQRISWSRTTAGGVSHEAPPAADEVYSVGAGADGSFCHRPKSLPSVSLQTANQPMLGTGAGSFASPPSSLTRAAPALMSSTSK
jgi:hypothetical protein